MSMAPGPLAGVRSILETPILDAHKWGKISGLDVDAVLLDLEDSVPPERKAEARSRVAECVGDPRELGDKLGLPRANPLSSPWGHDDLCALAARGASLVVYPKVRTADDVLAARDVLRDHGCDAGILPIIETAQAVLEMEAIAKLDCTVGFLFGPSDLATDVGWSLFAGDGLFKDAYDYPKSKLALMSAAYQLPIYDTVFVPDLRDAQQVQAAVASARAFGFTGMTTFYPPHLAAIRAAFSPSIEAVERARKIITLYEQALARGSAALQIDGRAIIVQDYKRAKRVLSQAREDPVLPRDR